MIRTKALLVLTILVHYIVVVNSVFYLFTGFLYSPIPVYILLVAFIARMILSRERCPITTLENYYRRQLGLAQSKGFVRDYMIRGGETIPELIKSLLSTTKETS